MTATVAFVNQKGGVGKTTVVLGLASAAWVAGHRILVVDADPQASATWALGLEPAECTDGTAAALRRGRPGAAAAGIRPSVWDPSIDVLPASADLVEVERGTGRDPLLRLRTALEGIADAYSLVLVDAAPSLGVLTRGVLVAATHAVIVVEPAAFSLRGIAAVADAVDDIWAEANPDLDLAGVILNKVPPISTDADDRTADLATIVGRKAVWQPSIPQRVVVPHAAAERQPIHALGHKGADVAAVFDALYAKLRRVTRGT